jgi:hypothetical protein
MFTSDPGDPDDVWSNPDVDFSPALNRILAKIGAARQLGPARASRIDLTARAAYHIWTPVGYVGPSIDITCPVEIVGEGTIGYVGMTRLIFHACDGIRVRVGDRVGSLTLRSVALGYVGSNTADLQHNGLTMFRVSRLHDVQIAGFPGYGAYWEGQPGQGTNVDMSGMTDVEVQNCGLTGVRITGGDANIMRTYGLNLLANGRRRVPGNGYNLHENSKLGCVHFGPHARNGSEANFCFDRGPGGAPNRSLIINAYSEHGPVSIPAHDQPGRDIVAGNAAVVTSMGEGSMADADTSDGGSVLATSTNRWLMSDVVQFGGKNGLRTILGTSNKRSPGDTARRQSLQCDSEAYVRPDGSIDLSRFFPVVHDPLENLWAVKLGSPDTSPSPHGVTDHRHPRGPGMFSVPRGLLVGPVAIGTHDPRNESVSDVPPVVTAAASLHGKFPLDKAKIGDVVLNTLPDAAGANFLGWVCSREQVGKAWRRFGEGQVGRAVVP